MSYCRFGEADAYIYMTYSGFDCCACSLATKAAKDVDDYEPVGPFTTARSMLDHIAEHRAQGDHIPDDVDLQIMSEYPDPDASVVETPEEREQRLIEEAPRREALRAKMKAAYEESKNNGSND